VDTGNGYQLLQDINGGPPRGALPMVPVASTTKVGDDIDGGPLGGHCRWVWQRPPQRLEMTSMADPLGALPVVPATSTTEVRDEFDGAPSGGRCQWVRHHPP
jgi:hypothetical protein